MKKIFMILVMCVCFIFIGNVYAANVTLSGSSTGTPGKKITITVKGDFTGRVNLNANNGTLSKSSVWIENNSQTVTVTLGNSGSTVVTATPATGASDKDGNIITVSAKSKTITISQPTTTGDKETTTTTKSSNCNLSKISLSVEGLSFKSSQTTYNIKVGPDVDNITVKATPAHSRATYTVSGNKNLKAGNNVIKIVVRAENGATKTYKINVEKAGDIEDTSAELSNLIIEDMTLDKPFAPTETEYTGSKMKYTQRLNILPYTVSEKATYEILGNEDFKEGENTIIIKVTSFDGTNELEYKVTFEMMSEQETNALQIVQPNDNNIGSAIMNEKTEKTFWDLVAENSTIILLYLLALVEFGQVIYLYVQLQSVNPDSLKVKRRRQK